METPGFFSKWNSFKYRWVETDESARIFEYIFFFSFGWLATIRFFGKCSYLTLLLFSFSVSGCLIYYFEKKISFIFVRLYKYILRYFAFNLKLSYNRRPKGPWAGSSIKLIDDEIGTIFFNSKKQTNVKPHHIAELSQIFLCYFVGLILGSSFLNGI